MPVREHADRGHRLHPHTADTILEAWGPSAAACIEEAVDALFESFGSLRGEPEVADVSLSVGAAPVDEQLALVLEEVLYLIDSRDLVTTDALVQHQPDGRLVVTLRTVPVDQVDPIGPVPKGISYGDLVVEQDAARWHCTVTVDV